MSQLDLPQRSPRARIDEGTSEIEGTRVFPSAGLVRCLAPRLRLPEHTGRRDETQHVAHTPHGISIAALAHLRFGRARCEFRRSCETLRALFGPRPRNAQVGRQVPVDMRFHQI